MNNNWQTGSVSEFQKKRDTLPLDLSDCQIYTMINHWDRHVRVVAFASCVSPTCITSFLVYHAVNLDSVRAQQSTTANVYQAVKLSLQM